MRKLPLLTLCAIAVTAIVAPLTTSIWSSGEPAAAGAEEQLAPMVVRAVFTDGRLWLLHVGGLLASMRPDDGEPEAVQGAGNVADMCLLSGHLMIVEQDDRSRRWLTQSRTGSTWRSALAVPTGGETLIAVNCDGERMMPITNRRLIEVAGAETHSTPLSEPFEIMADGPPATSTSHADDNAVWIGFNVGEWGGGLVSINRRTGRVEWIERNHSGEICGGPLNRACDPVNGIVASPWRASCVVAAIGLVHMMSHGRIIQICGTDVQRLYFKPLDPQPPNLILDEGEPPSTVAFYGLARRDDSLWSVGIDGLYRFSGNRVAFRPLPRFQTRGAYLVSFDIPGVTLVMTGSNQRTAMSGSVPVMAIH